MGYLIPSLIVKEPEDLTKLLYIEAIIMSSPLLFAFFVKDRPLYPPNISAGMKKIEYLKSFKTILTNKSYYIVVCFIILLIFKVFSFAMCLGCSWAIVTGCN